MVSIIAAVSGNGAIGKDNDMPWHISEDLKYFKKTTSGHPVIMGYNTFLSLGCRPLPGRRNIVVSTRQASGLRDGVELCSSLEAAMEISRPDTEEVFVIGGGRLYKAAMQYADKLYITEVHANVEDADVFFPAIDPGLWEEDSRSENMYDGKSGVEYSFVTYKRL